jgi:site-specific recombinase XerD
LNRISIKNRLINLHCFFDRITEWGYPNPPQRPLVFAGDLPIVDIPLPRFLDDAAAAKLLRVSRADPDPLARLIVELLARTGMRSSELRALTIDAVVQIGSAYWLRIPIGKLHTDRYIPLHPQLKELLDDWIAHHRPTVLRSDRLLLERYRPITARRIATALHRFGADAGIGHVTAHQLRHTLATQAINRGMSLDAIAALLGHKTLAMTMVYARIADKTVADKYFKVTEKVEALYHQPRRLPATDEGAEMRRRMLGNGYCARPVELDCHFESICESCTFFVTTIAFRPTLRQQRDDAERKGQVGRQKIFDGLLTRPRQPGGGQLVTAQGTCRDHPHMYNTEHHHTGLGRLTPSDVHHGLAEQRVAARAAVLATASGVYPWRFPGGLPQPPARPTEVWIPPHAPRDRGGAPTLNSATDCFILVDRFRFYVIHLPRVSGEYACPGGCGGSGSNLGTWIGQTSITP